MSKLASLISRVVSFVKADYRRFLLEIVLALVVWGMTYLVNRFTENRDLRTCQDERTVLLRANTRHQSLLDSIHYSGIIAKKDQTISEKDEKLLDLRRQRASDSIQLQTQLQSIRALNAYIQAGKSRLHQ